MIICTLYMVPVCVYVDTETRTICSIKVDDQAPFIDGEVEGVTREERPDLWSGKITPASRARLLRASEAIQADATDWPSWDIGF